MTTNSYASPQGTTANVVKRPTSVNSSPVFFPVSETKLLVLSLCTFGLYQYYWFYKNWKIIRNRTHTDIYPFWRAFFAVLFCYSLFDRIRKYDLESPTTNLNVGALATAWIVATLLWKLPDAQGLVSFAAVFALLPIQMVANAANRIAAPNHDPNARFSIWNWITVALGGPLVLLGVSRAFLLSYI